MSSWDNVNLANLPEQKAQWPKLCIHCSKNKATNPMYKLGKNELCDKCWWTRNFDNENYGALNPRLPK